MNSLRRPFMALVLAALLPTLVAIAGAVYTQLRAEPQRLRADTLVRCQAIMSLVDAQLRAEAAVLNVMSSSVYFQNHDWAEFYRRLARIKALNAAWVTLQLYDVDQGMEIFDLRRPMGEMRAKTFDAQQLKNLQKTSGPVVSGISPQPDSLIYVSMPVRNEGRITHVMSLGLSPQGYQKILMAYTVPKITSAVVDQHGLFVARNMNYEQRVGTLATTYVRHAIASAASGWYEGVTFEGLKNYTAYYTSPYSGWSTHIAVPYASLNLLSSWSFLIVVLAALGSLALGVTLIRIVMLDLEDRRNNEEALRQSQKMEAVGQLTGGIAHDFNNLLTPLIGNLDLIRIQARDNPSLQRMAGNALEAARRGAKLSARLMSFSRIQRLQLGPVDLPQLLAGMDMLLHQSLGPTIELDIRIEKNATTVLTDANQLELALLNLAVNARDAMPGGGTLTITAMRAQRVMRQLAKRPFVAICITDTGMGMKEEVRQRAMEPFFTTKPLGQSTGLGLSQVYSLMRECGGTIEIKSDEAIGTSVYLYLPLVEPMVRPAASSSARDKQDIQDKHTASVLVVDDDVEVGKFIHSALEAWNYQSTTVADGETALQLIDQQKFELMIVDFAMSKMNGAQVARAALAKQPSLRVLLVSGHSNTAVIEAELGEVKLLQKPFDLQQLKAAVDALLQAD